METTLSQEVSLRKKELTDNYIRLLDAHIREMKDGRVEEALEIRNFAEMLFVHPVHLSNTIKEVTGQSTCSLYEERLLQLSKELLTTTTLSIGQIAARMTYDPSNFTKFFKHYMGITPKEYRNRTRYTAES
ncbi:MAG TPA: helix-turn-helix transcriptional regulator [Flavisolibacter sp.]|jgi:AraC-like DNA-binding protein|nr:helix-turn-helix transcriptional regulator [Flavisolibacter sp.]